jgi:glycerol-3-phosphate dehydrogenase
MNLVVRPVARAQACGGLAAGRFLFVVPWRDASILGTSHDGFAGRADDLQVTAADLDTFLAEAREAFPAADLRAADVRLVHRGLLPTVDGSGPQIRLLRESAVVDHRHDGAPGFFSMFGVRYTTARDTAVRAITSVLRHRGTRSAESHTAATPLYGGNIADKNRFVSEAVGRAAGWSADGARRLAITYGTRFPDVLALAESDARFTRPLGSSCAVTAAEIVHAVRRESAIHLSDALIRRTEAGSAGHPGTEAIASAADLMSRELGWSAAQRQREIELVEEFYRLP